MKYILSDFFDFVQLRQEAYINKEILKLNPPYTKDEILNTYFFCNVFRDQDGGTKVLSRLYIEKLEDAFEVFVNILCYRFFNEREHFNKIGWIDIKSFDPEVFSTHVGELRKLGPVFNVAYISKKNEKVIAKVLEAIIQDGPEKWNFKTCKTAREVFEKLKTIKYIGPFLGYQLFLDLSLFNKTFHDFNGDDLVIVGPGAKPAIKLLLGLAEGPHHTDKIYEDYVMYIRDVQYKYLPMDFRPLTLDAIEHSLCEWRKYNFIKYGVGFGKYKKFKSKSNEISPVVEKL